MVDLELLLIHKNAPRLLDMATGGLSWSLTTKVFHYLYLHVIHSMRGAETFLQGSFLHFVSKLFNHRTITNKNSAWDIKQVTLLYRRKF